MSRQTMTAAEQGAERSLEMSYQEFLSSDFGERGHAEWVNGRVIVMAPVSSENIQLQGFIYALLYAFVDDRQLGCLFQEPFVMKTGPDLPGRSPDIIFIAKENASRIGKSELQGPADLAIEIVGPESRARDRKEKLAEYQAGGVREYWIIDPARKSADFLWLGDDLLYHPIEPDETGAVRSVVLKGVGFNPQWFWQSPLPQIGPIRKQWGVA